MPDLKLSPRDQELLALWKQGEDVPIDDSEDERTEIAWAGFPAGTPRMDIWHWFDQQFEYGLGRMLDNMTRREAGEK